MHNSLLRDDEDRPVGIIETLTDVTEVKRMERDIHTLREKINLNERMYQVSTFGAAMVHELGQPLSVIRLLEQQNKRLLAESSGPAEIAQNCDDILKQIVRITEIMDRYRSYMARPGSKSSERINLETIARQIADVMAANAHLAKIQIRLHSLDELPAIEADASHINQIFFVLMQNAIQAASGRRMHTLNIHGQAGPDDVVLRFSDDCGGIAPELVDRIFEPFFTTKTIGTGTGLGLSIVKQILLESCGDIRLENEFGQGSTFIVRLPIDPHRKG